MRRTLLLLAFALTLRPSPVAAQLVTPAASVPPFGITPPDRADAVSGAPISAALRTLEQAQATSDNRACDSCPPRRVLTSLLQVTYINVFYELANLIRGQDTAKITPSTWWLNMKRGWEWDLDDFVVNQIGHPYQGNNYFTAGRANGLDFWESAAVTAFGSGTWEYFGETNQASINDFINTTMGGIALGEMFHRTAWLVRDTTKTGKSRFRRELAATVIDPITGVNRFISGDSSRVGEKPRDMVPSALGVVTDVGLLWRGSNTAEIDPGEHIYVEADLLYGDLQTGRSRTPYDAFAVRLDFGGGSPLSEARVRGRLFGQPFHNGAVQLSVAQGYQFNKNDAYQFGSESVDTTIGFVKHFSDRTSLWAVGWGGVTILGAVDSLPPEGYTGGLPHPDEGAGQGVSTGPRNYDYGPGGNLGGLLYFARDARNFLTFSYELHQLHVLDGVRANHILQRGRADLHIPVKGRFGVGVTAEFFDRRTIYQLPGFETAHFYFPQLRTFVTWSQS